jgi:uncharacterized protein (UPF0335 family)
MPRAPANADSMLEDAGARKPGKGDNGTIRGVAADRLRSLVDRIERLEEEKKALTSDIKDIYLEAKSSGFDVKALRVLIRQRKQEATELEELEVAVEMYRTALGM